MSCAQWRNLLAAEGVDELAPSRREQFLIHLQSCSACRRAATEADPTVVFSLLPDETVEEREVEEIRRTVQTLRRLRALEASWSSRSWRAMAVGAITALVLLAVVLMPRPPATQSATTVPFAGAVGVGTGLVSLPAEVASTAPYEIELELATSATEDDLLESPAWRRLGRLELTATPGESVVRELGHGYQIRFQLVETARAGESPLLQGFALSDSNLPGRRSLFSADLEPTVETPLILGVAPSGAGGGQLWLRLSLSLRPAIDREIANPGPRD